MHRVGSCWAERAPVGAKQVHVEATAARSEGDGGGRNVAVLCPAC